MKRSLFIVVFLLLLFLSYSTPLHLQASAEKLHVLQIKSVVQKIVGIHEKEGGCTYSLINGNLAGEKMYAVSLFPDLGVVLSGKTINIKYLEDFVYQNIFLLRDPRCCIGTWFNEKQQQTYLDITFVLGDRKKAVELGKKYNQISVWDLFNFVEIPTGGDGKSIMDLPPPIERLPESNR